MACSSKVRAQNAVVDSLKRVLQSNLHDTSKVNILNDLGARMINASAYDSAKKYLQQGIVLSENRGFKKGYALCNSNMALLLFNQSEFPEAMKHHEIALKTRKDIHDKKGEADSYNGIGNIFFMQGNYQGAMEYYERSLKMKRELKDKKGISQALGNIGSLYNIQSNYPKALEYYLDGLKIKEELGDKNGMGTNYGNIGLIYYKQEDMSNALKYFNLSLKYREEAGNVPGVALCHSYIGLIYTHQNKFPEALDNFSRCLKIQTKLDNKTEIASLYAQIGEVYMYQKDFPKALRNYQHAVQVHASLKDKLGMIYDYQGAGKTYMYMQNFSEARNNLNKALELSKQVGSKATIAQLHSNLFQLDSIQADWKSALENYKLKVTTEDSVENKETVKKMLQLEMQYAFDKKHLADSLQNAQAMHVAALKLRQQRIAIILSIVVSVAIITLIVLLQRAKIRRTKREQKLLFSRQLLETELKALRAQMNPHFIFNCLNSIQAFILRENRLDATNYLQKFSRLIRLILDNSQKTSNTVEDETEILSLYLELEKLRLKNKFDFEINISEEIDSSFTEIPSMVIQPLVENSIWHGLMHIEDKGILKVAFKKGDHQLTCIVEDNGIGREKSKAMKPQNGKKHESTDADRFLQRCDSGGDLRQWPGRHQGHKHP